MKYYDIPRHWTKRIEPHLADPEVRAVLVRDMNKFTFGTWGHAFKDGDTPHKLESCDWWCEHRGPMPRYWHYVKHAACFWLVNFNLALAQRAAPAEWRIVASADHATVWDGKSTLFDMNFMALGVPPDEAFQLANKRQLRIGQQLRVYEARHFSADLPTRTTDIAAAPVP